MKRACFDETSSSGIPSAESQARPTGSPDPFYGGFYGYYGYATPLIYRPGYIEVDTIAESDNRLYRTEDKGELLWTGASDTRLVGDPEKTIVELSEEIVERLEKRKLLPAK